MEPSAPLNFGGPGCGLQIRSRLASKWFDSTWGAVNKTGAYFVFKHTFYFPKTTLYGIGCLDYPGSQHSYIGIDTGIVFVRTPITPGYDADQLAIGHQRTSRVACASIRISACGANRFLAYKIRTVAKLLGGTFTAIDDLELGLLKGVGVGSILRITRRPRQSVRPRMPRIALD